MPNEKKKVKRLATKVPTKSKIVKILEKEGSPCDLAIFAKVLCLRERSERKCLKEKIAALEKEGLLSIEGTKVSFVEKSEKLVTGVVSSHPRGFAFLLLDKGGPDVFLPPREAKTVLDGDRVLVKLIRKRNSDKVYGKVIKVIEIARSLVVGRYVGNRGRPFLEPVMSALKTPIRLEFVKSLSPEDGQLISAEVVRTSKGTIVPVANVVEVLGDFSDPEMPLKLAVRNHSIPENWTEEILSEVTQLSPTIGVSDFVDRLDLRDQPFVTIDGSDAKDYDDAVYSEPLDSGFCLYVAIADVAAYVKTGSAIDREAFERGNSVYFSQKVVPMLPERLSNDLCSLIPNEDRPALVARLEIDEIGRLVDFQFFEAVIRSKARLTYNEVQSFYDSGHVGDKRPDDVLENLTNLRELYKVLRLARDGRSALDIDGLEAIYEFDRGKIKNIVAVKRIDSQRVIEECMIIANVAAAKFCNAKPNSIPFRSHPEPDFDKIEKLIWEAKRLGINTSVDFNNPSRVCCSLLEKSIGRKDRFLIEGIVMRSQKLASYSSTSKSHFGLALPEYTHFTSPIRRYSDLVVHRVVKNRIGQMSKDNSILEVESLSLHCSKRERRADDATREELVYLKCEFMADKVDKVYAGIVSSIIDAGIFVQLTSNFVEGFVDMERVMFDRKERSRSGSQLNLGQSVTVSIERVDMTEGKIFLELISAH